MGGQVVRPAAATVVRTHRDDPLRPLLGTRDHDHRRRRPVVRPMSSDRYDRFWEPAVIVIVAIVLLFATR
jgi:hypothetical protein